MKKSFSIGLLVLSLLLTACGGNGSSSSSSNSSSSSEQHSSESNSSENTNSEASSESESSEESIVIPGVDDYEKWIDSWSEPGHVYFHYNRPGASDEEYKNYAIWLWPKAPLDLPGTLWGADDPKVLKRFHAMSSDWMTDIGGKGIDRDNTGKIMDIDLSLSEIWSGEDETLNLKDSFDKTTDVGFLIMQESSMGGGSNWVSDGSKDTIIHDFQTHWRPNRAMHIFIQKGSVDQYAFESGIEPIPNPTIDDTTGKYTSIDKNDVNSSVEYPGYIPTSEKFKDIGVGYQIFVPSFADGMGPNGIDDRDGIGDIRGIINKLDELEELGVHALWLTPIQKSESYHGYDTTDFYEIDKKFGTIDDYRELMYKAHQKNMVVLMDLVLNHTSKNNVWFNKSQKAIVETDPVTGEEINYRNMYHWAYKGDLVPKYDHTLGKWVKVPVEEHEDCWYRDGESNYYYFAKFSSTMPELNYDCALTRKMVTDMAKYWLGFGLDGFRLDAVKHIYMADEVNIGSDKINPNNDQIVVDVGDDKVIYDPEKDQVLTIKYDYSSDITKNINFWKYFAKEVKSFDKDCFLVGENFDGYGMRMAPYYQALDSQFDFSTYYHTEERIYCEKPNSYNAMNMPNGQFSETYEPFAADKNKLNDIYVDGKVAYKLQSGDRKDFINGAFTSNHDVLRAINHVNHNAEKVTGTATENGRAIIHAAATLLSPGLSWIYYGDELGMSSNTDKHRELYEHDNNMDIWYRQPYKWGEGDNSLTNYGFMQYKVEWDEHNKQIKSLAEQKASATDGDIYDAYKALCAIKNTFGKGAIYVPKTSSQSDVMYYQVKSSKGTFDIFMNAGLTGKDYSVPATATFINNQGQTNALKPFGIAVVRA